MPKVLHTIEHEYGICAKTRLSKIVHNMKARDPHGKQKTLTTQFINEVANWPHKQPQTQ